MTQQQPFEEIVDLCIERTLAGDALDDILRDYPQHADELRPLLIPLRRVTAARAVAPAASSGARTQALNSMAASIETERSAGHSRAAGSGGVGTMMGWFRSRPMAYRGLALLGGIALLGAVAAGASAAGTGPKPVREFFGFQADSSIRVEFEGVIRGVDTAGRALTVESGNDVRTVVVTDATELSDGGISIAFAAFAAGDPVEVKGTLQLDNTILASRVHREDGFDDDDATPSATQEQGSPVPNATPFDDDDDRDDDDDNSGPGSGEDDDGADDDNSGPGSGDDDDVDDDSSGPGSGDDDDGADDDNSDPGSGDDDDVDDDSSAPGSGDDDDGADDDSSGPGSGDDDDGADHDNSGPGSSDDDGGDDNGGDDDDGSDDD